MDAYLAIEWEVYQRRNRAARYDYLMRTNQILRKRDQSGRGRGGSSPQA